MYVLPANHLIWSMKLSEAEGNHVAGSCEEQREAIRPEFNRSIMIDIQGVKITSDAGFLLFIGIYERSGILAPLGSEVEETRSWVHGNPSGLQLVHQRIYQMAA
jgi:hypothetical protein